MTDWEIVGRVVHDWGPTVISVVAYAVAAFAWWQAHHATRAVTDDTLKTLLEWRRVHDEEAKQRDIGIAELRQISAAMKATADAQSCQLTLMQQELRDYRLGMGRGWTG
jgi:hypothetical protein